MATDTQSIATIENYAALAVPPSDIAEMLLAASGGQRLSPFDLDVVKVPSGAGAAMWSVQTLDGEEAVKTVEGIAILQRTVRSYWHESLEANGGGSPPDCSSPDGQIGRGDPGGECMDCPMAEFGSDTKNGRGQACKQNVLLFLLRPDSTIPMVVKVPPSSVKAIKSFVLRLAGRSVPPFGVVLSLALKKTQNAGNIAYFEIVPSLVRRLDDAEVVKVRALRDALLPVLTNARIEAE